MGISGSSGSSSYFESINSVFDYIFSFTNLEKSPNSFNKRTYRLDRMRTILDALGKPQEKLKLIHVAGSKGKGSTSTFLAHALTEHERPAGRRVGLFTSPHVSDPLERIQTPGFPVNEAAFFKAAGAIREFAESVASGKIQLNGHPAPTTFELLTALSLKYFYEAGCRLAVIETGIGGRLDATNIILPMASVITPIDLEHTDILGNTIEAIAQEKAGIVKEQTPLFCGYQPDAAGRVILERARKMNAPVRFLAKELSSIEIHSLGADGMGFTLNFTDASQANFRTRLVGLHQAENAALAYLLLKNLFPEIPLKIIYGGFEKTKLPGRFEIFTVEGTTLILDAAHTPLSVGRLLETLSAFISGGSSSENPDALAGRRNLSTFIPRMPVLIFGSVKGKNHRAMAEILGPHFERIIISKPGSFKESDPKEVCEAFERINENSILIEDPLRALTVALESAAKSEGNSPILVTGSFYMVAEIRRIILEIAGGKISH